MCCELSRWRAVPSKNDENTSVSGARGRQVGSAMTILDAFGRQVGSGIADSETPGHQVGSGMAVWRGGLGSQAGHGRIGGQ